MHSDVAQSALRAKLRGYKLYKLAAQSTLLFGQAFTAVILPAVIRLAFEPFFWLFGFRRKTGIFGLHEAARVLVVRSDEIGDVLLTAPFIRELRRNLPSAWITLIVKPAMHNIAECCPYIDEVLTYDWEVRGHGPMRDLRLLARAFVLASRRLWVKRFDLAISPRWDVDYYDARFVVYLSGAPCRVGYRSVGNDGKLPSGSDGLFTKVFTNQLPRHEVERGLDMLAFLGGTIRQRRLELWTQPADHEAAERLLQENDVQQKELLVSFGVGAREAKRMWPLANYVALGRWLVSEWNARIVVIGSAPETSLGEAVARGIGKKAINAVGFTTLREAGAILARCDLHIGNDSGPMHLAAAARIPVVEISCHHRMGSQLHPNSPARFRPWLVHHTIVQPQEAAAPCRGECQADYPHCIAGISIESVKHSVASQLARLAASPKHDRRVLNLTSV